MYEQQEAISFFASRNEDSSENFVKLTPELAFESLDVGLCFRISLRYSIPNGLISDNNLIFDLASPSKGYGYIGFGGLMTVFDLNSTEIKPTHWNHFCMTADRSSNLNQVHMKLFMNGQKYLDEYKDTKGNVQIVLKDLTVGKPNAFSYLRRSSFRGLVTDFVIFHRKLSDEEMIQFTKEFESLNETGITQSSHGSAKVYNSSLTV